MFLNIIKIYTLKNFLKVKAKKKKKSRQTCPPKKKNKSKNPGPYYDLGSSHFPRQESEKL